MATFDEMWKDCLEPKDLQKGVPTLKCIPVVFSEIIRAALVFAGITALIFIIWAGFNMINSGGDPKKVQGAKGIMTYAIIGLTIVLLSFSILYFIGYVTGSTKCITSFSNFDIFKDPEKLKQICQ